VALLDFFRDERLQEGRSTSQKLILGSVILGAVVVVSGIALLILGQARLGGTTLIAGFIIGVLPYGVISFLKNRAVSEIERQFPTFLNDLAESKRGGQTFIQALESSRDSDYGRLTPEIEKIYNEMTWGVPFPDVMERFSRRMNDSKVVQESLTILLQSFRSGGNITATIDSIADDAADLRAILQKKNSQVKQQVIIMYVIYFLFVGITIGIYVMMSQLLGLGTTEGGALNQAEFLGGSGGSANFCNGEVLAAEPFCVNAKVFGFVPNNVTSYTSDYATRYSYGQTAYYKSLMFVMLMIQGIATGAVAGQVSEGTPTAGVKHALIMLPLAFVGFLLTVGLA
jgi:Flp pilus assembly protein TadB